MIRTLHIALVAACCIITGCATSTIEQGLRLQDEGEYIESYYYFYELTQKNPGNREYRTYLNTSRRLAAEQCIGLAQQALASDDLDSFLDYMNKANEIKPSQGARTIIQLVESCRDRGLSDAKIRAELNRKMSLQTKDGTLGEALEETAARIAEKVCQRALQDPMSVLGVTLGNTERSSSACIYFENELSAALLKKAVRIVERKNLEEFRKEIEMSSTGIIDESQVLEIGKIAGAKSMITGNIFQIDRNVKYQLKVIDVQTSKIVFQDTRTFQPGKEFRQMLSKRGATSLF